MSDDEKPEALSWAEMAERAVKLASDDPDKFSKEVKILAKRLGMTVEEVYDKIQEDPKFATKKFRNEMISGVAKRIRKRLGF